MRARIAGTGSCLPKLRVTNDDLSRIMDTSDEWIRSRTGIGARHLAVEETTAGMSVSAARMALEEAGMQPEELELIGMRPCAVSASDCRQSGKARHGLVRQMR